VLISSNIKIKIKNINKIRTKTTNSSKNFGFPISLKTLSYGHNFKHLDNVTRN